MKAPKHSDSYGDLLRIQSGGDQVGGVNEPGTKLTQESGDGRC